MYINDKLFGLKKIELLQGLPSKRGQIKLLNRWDFQDSKEDKKPKPEDGIKVRTVSAIMCINREEEQPVMT